MGRDFFYFIDVNAVLRNILLIRWSHHYGGKKHSSAPGKPTTNAVRGNIFLLQRLLPLRWEESEQCPAGYGPPPPAFTRDSRVIAWSYVVECCQGFAVLPDESKNKFFYFRE